MLTSFRQAQRHRDRLRGPLGGGGNQHRLYTHLQAVRLDSLANGSFVKYRPGSVDQRASAKALLGGKGADKISSTMTNRA